MNPSTPNTSRTRKRRITQRAIALAAGVVVGLSACGGSDGDSSASSGASETDASADTRSAVDELGGAGQWTSAQLCSLSEPEAVGLLHGGVDVIERAGVDETNSATCFWQDAAGSALDSSLMSISHRGGFQSEALGADVDVEIPGTRLAGFTESAGGASSFDAAVGDQWLQITFPIGTAGAQDFGAVIATIWASIQAS